MAIEFGPEPKEWTLVRVDAAGVSIELAGSDGVTFDEQAYLGEDDLGAILLPGDRVAVVAAGALEPPIVTVQVRPVA